MRGRSLTLSFSGQRETLYLQNKYTLIDLHYNHEGIVYTTGDNSHYRPI